MSGRSGIHVGTSGWSYPKGEGTWKGFFYPPGKYSELEYYSRFFNAVEVNSSFYRPPAPAYTANWVKQTPRDFLFTIKLWQKFTHPDMYRAATGEYAVISQEDVDLFMRGIKPLYDAGKLGVLLAQFPPGFKNGERGRRILRAVINAFRRYRLAVELRDRSWSDDEHTARLLEENNVSWVWIDEPKFSTSIATELPVTSDIAYFRFHGRNRQTWWQGDSETRYRYLYSTEEISGLAAKVKAASAQTRLTYAFFNNHWQGYAPRNAVAMKKALRLPFREIPVQSSLGEASDREEP